MTSEPETATIPVEAPKAASKRKRNILIVAAIAVIVVDVVAYMLFPPVNLDDPSAPYSWPADAIKGNIEAIVPHTVWDPTPETPPSTDLITFDVTISASLFTMWIVMIVVIVLVVAGTRPGREDDPLRPPERGRVDLRDPRELRDVAGRPGGEALHPAVRRLSSS